MPQRPIHGVRVHTIITKPQKQALERLATRTGMPASEHMRRAIDFYLDAVARKKTNGA